jgi:hypothetical protein
LFLFACGVFISIDTYSGDLGDQRLVSAVKKTFFLFSCPITHHKHLLLNKKIFYYALYGISIGWIIFLYVDVRIYSSELLKEIRSKTNPDLKDTDKTTEDIYLEWKSTPGNIVPRAKSIHSDYQNMNDYEDYGVFKDFYEKEFEMNPRLATITAAATVPNIRQKSFRRKNKRTPGKLKTIDENQYNYYSGVFDLSTHRKNEHLPTFVPPALMKTKFDGYLNVKNADFNLYLKAGVGSKLSTFSNLNSKLKIDIYYLSKKSLLGCYHTQMPCGHYRSL